MTRVSRAKYISDRADVPPSFSGETIVASPLPPGAPVISLDVFNTVIEMPVGTVSPTMEQTGLLVDMTGVIVAFVEMPPGQYYGQLKMLTLGSWPEDLGGANSPVIVAVDNQTWFSMSGASTMDFDRSFLQPTRWGANPLQGIVAVGGWIIWKWMGDFWRALETVQGPYPEVG